jgi:hypothetical protein
MAKETSKSINDLVADIGADPTLQPDQKVKLLTALQSITPPLQSDKWIYRMVVIALGVGLVITIIGGIVSNLTGQPKSLPDGLIAIGSAAVGALAGLLAPSPITK